MELKWNGKGMEKKHITTLELKFNGMEWKQNGIRMENLWEKKSVGYGEEMERKWNGNGMEFFLTNQVEKKLMEWNRNGMELKWKHSSDKVYMIVYRKQEWRRRQKTKKFLI